MHTPSLRARSIGSWGTAVRVVGGVALVVGAIVGGVETLDAVLGLVVFPAVVAAAVALRGGDAPPIRLMGPEGCCINGAVIVAGYVFVPVAALVFYGVALLLAAARGYGGCEVFAVSNWLWRRDDQIACPVLDPVDRAERRAAARRVAR